MNMQYMCGTARGMNIMPEDKKTAHNDEKLPTMVKLLSKNYTDYVNKVEKSDMKNSFTRYSVQLNMAKQIKAKAAESGREDQVAKWAAVEQEIRDKLSEMGFTIE